MRADSAAQPVVEVADSALGARIVAVSAAALRAAAGFGIAADIAGIVGIVEIVAFVGMVAVAHIVEVFAVDNRARQARLVARGIALAAHIAAAAADNFARGMCFAESARPAGRAAARARNSAALDIAVVAYIAAGFGTAAVALVAGSFGMPAARNFAQASL